MWVKARLDQAALSHCKGSALAVAIDISNKCGVGDAHRGLASNLHSKHCFNAVLVIFTAVKLGSGLEWQPSFNSKCN